MTMRLASLLVRAIEGQITDREVVKVKSLHFEISQNEIRMEVGKGEQRRVFIWVRDEGHLVRR